MKEPSVDKPILLQEECEKLNSHQWIIKEDVYVCEFCGKECRQFTKMSDYERNILKSNSL